MKTKEIKLGYIAKIYFGLGGYQDTGLGLHITLSSSCGWGVNDSKDAWDANLVKHSDRCKWTEKDRDSQYSDIMRFISDLLSQAKVKSIDELKGIPVEATFEGMKLKSWRILTEVL